MNVVVIGLGCGFGGYAAYHLFASGLSDTLGLKTLRHGTGPCNYLSIQKEGALPELGGISRGEASLFHYDDHTRNRFFVWNDDFHQRGTVVHNSRIVIWLMNCKSLHPLVKRIGAKFYCIQNGVAAATMDTAPAPLRVFLQILGGIGGLLTPVLDFHVTPEKFEERFQIDQGLVPVARHTSRPLKSWKYIGLPGVLYQGVNRAVFTRIKNDPIRFITGVAKLLLLTVLILSILSLISTYGSVTTGLINVYALITNTLAAGTVLIPLSAGCGIVLPFVSLAVS